MIFLSCMMCNVDNTISLGHLARRRHSSLLVGLGHEIPMNDHCLLICLPSRCPTHLYFIPSLDDDTIQTQTGTYTLTQIDKGAVPKDILSFSSRSTTSYITMTMILFSDLVTQKKFREQMHDMSTESALYHTSSNFSTPINIWDSFQFRCLMHSFLDTSDPFLINNQFPGNF